MRIFKTLFFFTALLFSHQIFAQDLNQYCSNPTDFYEQILQQVKNKHPNAIRILPECFKANRNLILKVVLIDPSQFQNASELLKEDENFVRRLLKIDATILQYASPKLRSDKAFMLGATYLNRDALQYADEKLLDNKLFMKEMIRIDSRNYIFASNRLKEIPEFAKIAFADDGNLLKNAPQKIKSDKNLVKIAFKSNNAAIDFASEKLKKDKEFTIIKKPNLESEEKNLKEFLQKNYVDKSEKKNLPATIANKAKFFPKQKIIDRNYITKWQGISSYSGEKINEELRLISVNSRNYPISWKKDFRKYPDLIAKLEKFFLNHNIDHSTIENLMLTYLWKIKSNPPTFAFNLYLLRDSSDYALGPKFSDITSLTAIIQKQKNKFEMSVVEVIFDSEVKTEINYTNGHKKYILWDLYKASKNEKNPKVIFKVEDSFEEYFEIFEEQSGGKYKKSYRINLSL